MPNLWRNISPVIENRLFLGNIAAALSSRSLTECRITHILSVCDQPIPAESPQSGFRHTRIIVEDVEYADLLIHLPFACQFIEKALQDGGNVLVHCDQGLSRSAAVVAAYLMRRYRMTSTKALETIRAARDQIWVNPGFQEQLVLFELCQYSPSPSNGYYVSWKMKLDRQLQAAGLAR